MEPNPSLVGRGANAGEPTTKEKEGVGLRLVHSAPKEISRTTPNATLLVEYRAPLGKRPGVRGQYIGAKMAVQDDLVDAKIALSEAYTETKIVRLEGKIDLVVAKLDTLNENSLAMRREVKESERSIKATAWVIFGALVVMIVGTLAILFPVFDLGLKIHEMVVKEIHDVQPPRVSPPNNP